MASNSNSETVKGVNNDSTHILIGCTGSVASIKLLQLVSQLQSFSWNRKLEIKVVATENALHFFDANGLPPDVPLFQDKDEWETWTKRGDPVIHIELRRWADLFVIAPLDANTLAKIANGICDNLLTCVARAWDMKKPLLYCPAMNTYMWDHPLTARHLAILQDLGYREVPVVKKTLICGDIGNGAMAEVNTIVTEIFKTLSEQSQNSN